MYFRSFVKNTNGATATIFAVCLIPLSIGVGVSVDYGRALLEKNRLQNAMDDAVLAGVGIKYQGIDKTPIESSVLHFTNNVTDSAADQARFFFSGEEMSGTFSTRISTTFMNLAGIPQIDLLVRAKATTESIKAPACVLAMHPFRKHTLELHDAVTFSGPDCHIYANSSHTDDVVDPHTIETFLVGKSVQAVGYGHNYLGNVTPPVEYAPEVLPDPLAGMAIPAGSPVCDNTDLVVAGGAAALTPGVYCGGLRITGGTTVTMAPGTYFIRGDVFQVDASILTGDDVTVVLEDDAATLNWNEASIQLKAPAAGPLAGMVIINGRFINSHAITDSDVDLYGVVYLVGGDFTWHNAGSFMPSAEWTVWIVDGFSWHGTGTVHQNFRIAASEIPYPVELLRTIPRPGTPRLIQ
jgi:Putative Flp pilus-assembly TadE/G-like